MGKYMETGMRIVKGGNRLTLRTKRIVLTGEALGPDEVQLVCSEIGKRYGIAAVPYVNGNSREVLIPFTTTLPTGPILVKEWLITPEYKGENIDLSFAKGNRDKQLIADLYKRAFLLQCKRNCKSHFWTLDSPRILYQTTPFFRDQEYPVIGFRRFEISELILEEGLAFSVGVSTSFFSSRSALDFIQRNETDLFNHLTNRQKEQKGTLLYKGPNGGRTKCWFVKFAPDKNLSTTPKFKEKETEYASAYDYYNRKFPAFDVKPDDKVAIVSFPGMDKDVYVPAKCIFPRIFNNSLPNRLVNLDKINPSEKRELLVEFWNKVGNNPFGFTNQGLEDGFFCAPKEKIGMIVPPALIFGQNKILEKPDRSTQLTYKQYYKDKKKMLDKHGCYYIPPTLTGSKLYFAFPKSIGNDLQKKFSADILKYFNQITRGEVELDVVTLPAFENYLQATVALKKDYEPGTVLFVFEDEDPATYSLIDYELKGWGIKRATSGVMLQKDNRLNKAKSNLNSQPYEKAKRDWESYIEMIVLDMIQQMNCIPYIVPAELFNYDMQVVLDVSEDYSHFCISGMFFSQGMPMPILPCNTFRKTDNKMETINAEILKDELVKLFNSLKRQISRYGAHRVLFLRDGKDCKNEFDSIKNAMEELIATGVLPNNTVFDFVEYHKKTRKDIRFWDMDDMGNAANVLEGTFMFIRPDVVTLATTGNGTLTQAMPDPVTVINKYTQANMINVIKDLMYGAQLNYSSPKVAQKLTLPAKRADDELAQKRAQEIKRLK